MQTKSPSVSNKKNDRSNVSDPKYDEKIDPHIEEDEQNQFLPNKRQKKRDRYSKRMRKQPYDQYHSWQRIDIYHFFCLGQQGIELSHLRNANFGFRWAMMGHSHEKKEEENDEEELAPRCVVGPHWWLMVSAYAVMAIMAVIVSILTIPRANLAEGVTGVALCTCSLTLYALVACTNPGIVARIDTPLDESYSWCDYCCSYRPSGAMHCMDCRACIEKYDHHCPWTSKCIGKGNVVYFYFWLLSLVLAFVYEIIELTIYLLPPPEEQPQSNGSSFSQHLRHSFTRNPLSNSSSTGIIEERSTRLLQILWTDYGSQFST